MSIWKTFQIQTSTSGVRGVQMSTYLRHLPVVETAIDLLQCETLWSYHIPAGDPLTMSGNIFVCHKGWEGVAGSSRYGSGMLPNIIWCTGQSWTANYYLAPNVNGAEGKPWGGCSWSMWRCSLFRGSIVYCREHELASESMCGCWSVLFAGHITAGVRLELLESQFPHL